jgi:hypothetical protein
MPVFDLSEVSDGSPFCIKRLIVNKGKYLAEIQPIKTRYKIEIQKEDYKKILEAFQHNRIVKLYPFEGKVNNENEFINGKYKIEVI